MMNRKRFTRRCKSQVGLKIKPLREAIGELILRLKETIKVGEVEADLI